jgi:myo-inositol-1(or 4)-monophosphatase
MMDIKEFASVGTEVARRAGKYALDRFRTEFSVEHKGAINLVTDVDITAEEMIVARLQEMYPDHSILAEEKNSEICGGTFTWVIDPLDGTTNYAHGFPFFSVSIGLEISGKVVLGIVYDPVRDELFTAQKDSGAFCNDEPLQVSSTESLDAALLATGFPYDIRTSEQNNLRNFCAFALQCQGVRRTGSAALDLCYVASGRIDGFWESKLNPWDCAAGYLIVSEAGGLVTDYSGGPASIYKAEVTASNGRIHQEMISVLKSVED